jgi:hypothetical protein
MCELWCAFKNYNYDELCAKILDLRKNKDESLEEFFIRFMHLFYRFPLDDRPFFSDLILHLISLTTKMDQLEDEESESCLNDTLHVDLDLHENVENINDLVNIICYDLSLLWGI